VFMFVGQRPTDGVLVFQALVRTLFESGDDLT
jgi:hypothetical protein